MLWMRPLAPLLLLVILSPAFANSSGRYAAYDYDLTTPQYTPDGRLLQVEYASNACMRSDSNPLVAVGCTVPCNGEEEEEAVVVMATVSSPPSSSASTAPVDATNGAESKEEEVVDKSTRDAHQRTQFRIVEVPLSAPSPSGGTCSILVGLSGILADATSLLQIVHSKLDEEQRVFGWHRLGLSPVGVIDADGSDVENVDGDARIGSMGAQSIAAQPSETALRLSRAIADECQKHAFGGGLRPFGASLLLAGVDPARGPATRVGMGETHPNGGWRSHSSILGSNGREATSIDQPRIVVSGGAPKAQSQLKSLVTTRLNEIYREQSSLDTIVQEERIDDETAFLRSTLQAITWSLVEEWKGRGNPVPTNDQEEHRELPQMEVVISSSKREAEAAFVNATTINVENVTDNLFYAYAKNCALLKEAVMDFVVENGNEVAKKVCFDDVPGSALTDLLTAVNQGKKEGAATAGADDLSTAKVSTLRKMLHEKGLDVDGSREAMIALLEKHSSENESSE